MCTQSRFAGEYNGLIRSNCSTVATIFVKSGNSSGYRISRVTHLGFLRYLGDAGRSRDRGQPVHIDLPMVISTRGSESFSTETRKYKFGAPERSFLAGSHYRGLTNYLRTLTVGYDRR